MSRIGPGRPPRPARPRQGLQLKAIRAGSAAGVSRTRSLSGQAVALVCGVARLTRHNDARTFVMKWSVLLRERLAGYPTRPALVRRVEGAE